MKFIPAFILPIVFAVALTPTLVSAAVPAQNLTLGSRGVEVTWLQEFLISKNQGASARALATAGATGYFGIMTRSALAEYQSANGITPAAGFFGPKTRAHIEANSTATGEVFTGEITAVRTDCFFDGVCSVTVGGKEVVLLTGMRVGEIPPVGSLKGVDSIGDLEKEIGKRAKVYAVRDGNGYSLYGNADFYVQVLAEVPENGEVSIEGTIGCLPPKDPTKPTVALCAFGLAANDGNHYALKDSDEDYDNISTAASGEKVRVEGIFTAQLQDTWDSVGIIEVSDIEEVK